MNLFLAKVFCHIHAGAVWSQCTSRILTIVIRLVRFEVILIVILNLIVFLVMILRAVRFCHLHFMKIIFGSKINDERRKQVLSLFKKKVHSNRHISFKLNLDANASYLLQKLARTHSNSERLLLQEKISSLQQCTQYCSCHNS